ncbi:hypothetical protein [Spiroplasma diminutum]|uniref:Uncharacterized protein n=1 Tax=Spiroplasma diminutum CUAS-1 TaxID=1276221 RepID=S5LWX7_9MOLU|nr:hypothetical protein [Spiroplasma diminutum]AGR42294.1 hypothetical protein SDIMI_v3c05900 [Spiroplasma diminutum CUAS-1]
MFYRSDDFWSEIGATFINAYLKLDNIKNSKDELFELISDEDITDEEILEVYGKEVYGFIKSWEVSRKIVLKVKEFEKKFSRRVDTLLIEEFIQIYKYLDPSEEYIDMFKGYTPESREFLEKLEKGISKLSIVETFDSIVEYLLASAFDFTLHNYLGEITFRYLFWLFQTAMISRGYGIAVFDEEYEMNRMVDLYNKVLIYARQNNSKNFALSKEFREFVSLYKEKIEHFSQFQKNKYIG